MSRFSMPAVLLRPRSMLALVAVVHALLPTQSAAAINKCVDAAGKVTYQSGPCPAAAAQQQAIKPDAPPRTAEPKAGDASQDEAIVRLITVQAGYEYCSQQRAGGLGAEVDKKYAAWRAKNAADLRRYESSPRFVRLMEGSKGAIADFGPAYCERYPAFLGGQ